jgi:hypothetical protein
MKPMPIDYKNYPANWKTEIRPAILARENNCCKFCGVPNHSIGFRGILDEWHEIECSQQGDEDANMARDMGFKVIRIVLTVAHLDHDVTNNDYGNLAALCQKCHNRYDIKNRVHNRSTKKGQIKIFE